MAAPTADPLMMELDEELGELGTTRHPPIPIAKPGPTDGNDAKDGEASSPLAKIKELNEHAAKHPYVRRAKTVIFFCMALYGLITMLLEFGATFQKHPEFSTDPGDERCIPRFYDAEKFAEEHRAAKVGFWVGAGTVRIAVCADETDAKLDAAFAGMERFDPLAIITPGECMLDRDADVADAVRSCVVSGDGSAPSRMAGCAAAFSTTPMPRGVGWSYVLKKMPSNPPTPKIDNQSTAVPLPAQWNITSYSSSASASNATTTGRCRVLVERNDAMPACPYSNVRFYERKNVWLALLYIFTALWNLGMVFFELYQIGQFTMEAGPNFGDLTYMIAPFDGSVGAFYSLYRFARRLPELSELPDPSWLQFARSGFTSALGFGVSLSAMWGCAITWNVMMFVLFLFSILKFAYDAGSYIKGRLCPARASEEPMSPGRHERNDTPMPDEDKLGILLYQHARKVIATTQHGVWHGHLQQFASCNAAQRDLLLNHLETMLPQVDPRQPARGAAWDWDESDEYVLAVTRLVLIDAAYREKPPSWLQRAFWCCFRKKSTTFPQWIVEERARIQAVAANPNLDAHLVRRRIVTRLVIIDTMLQAVEGGAACIVKHPPFNGAGSPTTPESRFPVRASQHAPPPPRGQHPQYCPPLQHQQQYANHQLPHQSQQQPAPLQQQPSVPLHQGQQVSPPTPGQHQQQQQHQHQHQHQQQHQHQHQHQQHQQQHQSQQAVPGTYQNQQPQMLLVPRQQQHQLMQQPPRQAQPVHMQGQQMQWPQSHYAQRH